MTATMTAAVALPLGRVSEGGQGAVLAGSLLLALVVSAGLGSLLRAVVLHRVAGSRAPQVRVLGAAWVNAPASALAALALVLQQGLDLVPGRAPGAVVVAVAAVIGLCGGLSTYSTLALEMARSVLERRRRDLALQLAGVALGVAAGLFGAGVAALLLLALP